MIESGERRRGDFAALLRELRRSAGISQEALAERANVSVESVGALERGRRRAPYRETIRLIADALGLGDADRRRLEEAARRARMATAVRGDDAAATPIRHGFVRPLSSMHGRAAELADVDRLLRAHRLVSVVGAGGIGKTRIAIEVGLAAPTAEAWFVDLAALDDDSVVMRALMAALGVAASPGADDVSTVAARLVADPALLVFDNCEHVVDQVAAIAETLLRGCPNLRILTTTREPLRVAGERIYRLAPLQLAPERAVMTAEEGRTYPAIDLFVDRARAANPAFAYTDAVAPTIAAICRRLDGIALAIELAASRTAVLAPDQVLAQLATHFDILTGGSRTALPRQRTMRETIAWSDARLSAAEQRLFRQCAVFVDGFTFESVCGIREHLDGDVAETLDLLTSLVHKSLIVTVEAPRTRYRMLEPMRAYAIDRLRREGEYDAVQAAAARWWLAFAERLHDAWETLPSATWSATVEADLENLRASVTWSLDGGYAPSVGRRLVGAGRRIWARLLPSEGRRLIGAALAASADDDDGDRTVEARLRLADAHVATALEDYASALAAAEACAPLLRPQDVVERAELHGFTGLAHVQLGRERQGEALLESAAAVYRAHGRLQLLAYAISDLGIAHVLRGELEPARALFREAVAVFRALHNERGASSVAANLAEVEFASGDPAGAARLCEEALATSPSGREARLYLSNLAAYLIALGRFEDARDAARECLSFGGTARADVDSTFALQHLAAVAALRPNVDAERQREDRERAVRIIAFVDERLRETATTRQHTERQEYDAIAMVLDANVPVQRRAELTAECRFWTEERAIAEARAV